jgi:hypothetical protein
MAQRVIAAEDILAGKEVDIDERGQAVRHKYLARVAQEDIRAGDLVEIQDNGYVVRVKEARP